MQEINYDMVIEELQKKNLYNIQKELTIQRKTRTFVMSLLLAAFTFTFVYGTLENPFTYTLSNIGNFFNYRFLFIVWSVLSGLSIEITLVTLMRLEKYSDKKTILYLYLATFFLIATALIPALKQDFPFWHYTHVTTSVLLAIFYTLSVIPFSIWISKENPRLRRIIMGWLITIWVGSVLMVIFYQHSALFEIWFFGSMILFTLYLSLILFEEKIIKMSIKLMSEEQNLNEAVEKIFIDLEAIQKAKLKKALKQAKKEK